MSADLKPRAWALPIPAMAGGGDLLRSQPTADRPEAWEPLYDAAALAGLTRERDSLKAEAESFHMAYRLKCDEETKTQAVEIERLRAELDALKRQEPIGYANQRTLQMLAGLSVAGYVGAKITRVAHAEHDTSHPLYAAPTPAADAEALRDALRYRSLRRGQHWSVINGIGDTLRADELDAAIDAALAADAGRAKTEGGTDVR